MIKTQICQALLKNSKHTALAAEPARTGKSCFKATTAIASRNFLSKSGIQRKTSNYNSCSQPREKLRRSPQSTQYTQTKKACPHFCPRCASSKMVLPSSLKFWITPKAYACQDCCCIGITVLELVEKSKKESENVPATNPAAPNPTASSTSCIDSER